MSSERTASIEINIPFHDVDSMNVVWHGNYAKYLELARCELLDSFNYSYQQMLESGFTWPIVDMRIKYLRPVVFGQDIRVIAKLKEWEYRLKIDYLIVDANSGEKITKGYSIQIAVNKENGEMCYPSPDILAQRLGLAEPPGKGSEP